VCYMGYWLLGSVVDITQLSQLCCVFEVNGMLLGILVVSISG
jgi:hypothetical protein